MLLRASADHRQPSNLPHSWSGRNSDFHTWLWGPTPQWLPWLGEWGGRVSSMPLCPEEVIHEGISHSGSGGCRSGGSPVGSGTLRGKQLAQGPLCYPRDPAPTSSATCSSALAASSSAALVLRCCAGFSPVVVSRGYSLIASVRASHSSEFSCCRALAPGPAGFSSCSAWTQWLWFLSPRAQAQ